MPGRSASMRGMSSASGWAGPTARPLPGATGAGLALPLLARVFDLLPPAIRADRRAAGPTDPGRAGVTGGRLRLLFPPPGAVLSREGPVTIRAMGGRRPLTFLVDGAPLAAEPARREAAWRPPGPGLLSRDRARRGGRRRTGFGRGPMMLGRLLRLLALAGSLGLRAGRQLRRREMGGAAGAPLSGLPLVQVSVNGMPANMVLDTGAQRTLLTSSAAARLSGHRAARRRTSCAASAAPR